MVQWTFERVRRTKTGIRCIRIQIGQYYEGLILPLSSLYNLLAVMYRSVSEAEWCLYAIGSIFPSM
jgi:hypothetical protein